MLRRFCAWLTALGLLGLGLLVQNRPAPISAAENTTIGDPILLEQADAPAAIGPTFTGLHADQRAADQLGFRAAGGGAGE